MSNENKFDKIRQILSEIREISDDIESELKPSLIDAEPDEEILTGKDMVKVQLYTGLCHCSLLLENLGELE